MNVKPRPTIEDAYEHTSEIIVWLLLTLAETIGRSIDETQVRIYARHAARNPAELRNLQTWLARVNANCERLAAHRAPAVLASPSLTVH
jgi:hypothetical protein